MSFNKLEYGNCLFLICPTDHIENVLSQTCSTKSFFYTALGASFNWDVPTQQNLTILIKKQKITQAVFITKHTNLFYKEALESDCESLFQVSDALLALDKTLPDYFLKQSHPILRRMLLASRHLQNQQRHILETSILGKTLKTHKVITQSFVYHSDNEVFYPPRTIEERVLAYGKVPLN